MGVRVGLRQHLWTGLPKRGGGCNTYFMPYLSFQIGHNVKRTPFSENVSAPIRFYSTQSSGQPPLFPTKISSSQESFLRFTLGFSELKPYLLYGGLGLFAASCFLTLGGDDAQRKNVNSSWLSAALRSYMLATSTPALCRSRWFPDSKGAAKEHQNDTPVSFLATEDVSGSTSVANPLWRSKQSKPVEKKNEETAIFSGSSNLPLAEAIAECLGTRLGTQDADVFWLWAYTLCSFRVYSIKTVRRRRS